MPTDEEAAALATVSTIDGPRLVDVLVYDPKAEGSESIVTEEFDAERHYQCPVCTARQGVQMHHRYTQ